MNFAGLVELAKFGLGGASLGQCHRFANGFLVDLWLKLAQRLKRGGKATLCAQQRAQIEGGVDPD